MGDGESKLALSLIALLFVSAGATMTCDWDECTPAGPQIPIEFAQAYNAKFFSTKNANCKFEGVDTYALDAINSCLNLWEVSLTKTLNCLLGAPDLLDKLAKISALAFRLKRPLTSFLSNIESSEFEELEFSTELTSNRFKSVENKVEELTNAWDKVRLQRSLTNAAIKDARANLKVMDSVKCVKESLDKAAKKSKAEMEKKSSAIASKIISELSK